MLKVNLPTAAAWAPWADGRRDWLIDRVELSAKWLSDRAVLDGSHIVLQVRSHAADYRRDDGPIAHLAREGAVATYKSRVGHGATFVDSPDIRLMATAMSTAAGHALAATELPTCPLIGWAMATGAVNLATGEVTADTRTPTQIDTLAIFISHLYNGWAHKQVGRRASAHYLPKLADSGMTYVVFLGSMLASAPRYLDSRSDIAEMKRALPPAWRAEAEQVAAYDYFARQ
ncbi:hypothetical protein [Nocardioides renjunii]|uniref:hypothetical protein n=1 Tax=Nocardioides renjunii TaxID=3095075 RepID=UPI002AFE9B8C|nr:hypothetical protein [Nocardioides sp. S-34]WQQ21987.1 hypothetical protein SHK17_19115 [Nocardioides sp. S-34]